MIQQAQLGIGGSGSGLDQAQRADKGTRQSQVTDSKIIDCALGLCTLKRIGGHPYFPQTVFFQAIVHCLDTMFFSVWFQFSPIQEFLAVQQGLVNVTRNPVADTPVQLFQQKFD